MRAPVLEVSNCDYSNQVDINSAWRSLVASCACMVEARTGIFNMLVSSAKVCISSVKRIHLQRQKYLSPAQNAYIASDKHVHCGVICNWR